MKWTKKEEELAAYLFNNGKTHSEIAHHINRTKRAVSLKLRRMGFNRIEYCFKRDKPKIFCKQCGSGLTSKHQKKFCSHKCSSIYNNKLRRKLYFCIQCGGEIKGSHRKESKYCSGNCFHIHEQEEYVRRWMAGEEKGWNGKVKSLSNRIRRFLRDKHGTACMKCGWDEKHPIDGRALTEINHIDGDAENCMEDNLEVICPNCHSMTPNFRARNKNSKRIRNGRILLNW